MDGGRGKRSKGERRSHEAREPREAKSVLVLSAFTRKAILSVRFMIKQCGRD